MLRTVAALAAFLIAPSVAFAADCYALEDRPSWTLTKTDDGFVWDQNGKKIVLAESGAGTGIMARVLFPNDGGDGYRFIYHANDIIMEMEVYKRGC